MQQMSSLQRLTGRPPVLQRNAKELPNDIVGLLASGFRLLVTICQSRLDWIVKFTTLFSLLSLLVVLVSCSEENPQELVPDESLKPLLASAPLLIKENHPHGWEKENCLECHKPLTITGHGKIERKCTDCHGRNGVGGVVDTCETCHGYPPDTGDHISHVKEGQLSCEKCHADYLHANSVLNLNLPEGGEFSQGTCTTKCHKSVEWGESGCSSCHGNPPNTGNHGFHVKESEFSCEECHADNIHINDVVDLNFAKGGEYSDETCSSIACHGSVKWGGSGCSLCHGNPPDTEEHRLHVEESGLDCDSCHQNKEHDRDTKSGEIDIGGVEYELLDGSCTPVCHEEEKWNCESCHGYPPDTGQHGGHESFDCNICHNEHDHSYKAATEPSDFSLVEIKFEIMGSYEKADKTCKTVGCHEDREW